MDLFDKRLDFTDFKNRLVKAGSIFKINKIDKSIAYQFIKEYHYLKDAKFFAKCNDVKKFGLIDIYNLKDFV